MYAATSTAIKFDYVSILCHDFTPKTLHMLTFYLYLSSIQRFYTVKNKETLTLLHMRYVYILLLIYRHCFIHSKSKAASTSKIKPVLSHTTTSYTLFDYLFQTSRNPSTRQSSSDNSSSEEILSDDVWQHIHAEKSVSRKKPLKTLSLQLQRALQISWKFPAHQTTELR